MSDASFGLSDAPTVENLTQLIACAKEYLASQPDAPCSVRLGSAQLPTQANSLMIAYMLALQRTHKTVQFTDVPPSLLLLLDLYGLTKQFVIVRSGAIA